MGRVQGSKSFEGTRVSAKVLYTNGDRAALTAKWARPLDLQTVAVRNDLGEARAAPIAPGQQQLPVFEGLICRVCVQDCMR